MIYIIFGVIFVVIAVVVIVTKVVYAKNEASDDPFKDGEKKLVIASHYIEPKQLEFYMYISKRLNNELVILPRVELDGLVEPFKDKRQYNAICGKTVDFVIFEKKEMKPLVAIDMVDPRMKESVMKVLDKYVVNALSIINLPIVNIEYKEYYVFDDVMAKVKEALGIGSKKQNKDTPK